MGQPRVISPEFEAFLKMDDEGKRGFLGQLALWCDMNLPDGDYFVISKTFYFDLMRGDARREREDEKLYDLAKKLTLDHGFPYYDPRTGEVTLPPTKEKGADDGKHPDAQ